MHYYKISRVNTSLDQTDGWNSFGDVSNYKYERYLNDYLDTESAYLKTIFAIMQKNKIDLMNDFRFIVRSGENMKNIPFQLSSNLLSDFENNFRKCLRGELWSLMNVGGEKFSLTFSHDMWVYISSEEPIKESHFVFNDKYIYLYQVSREFWEDWLGDI